MSFVTYLSLNEEHVKIVACNNSVNWITLLNIEYKIYKNAKSYIGVSRVAKILDYKMNLIVKLKYYH